MPDVHLGKGATVGSVIAMRDAVSPAAVGVDIGCGMAAVPTTLTAAESARRPEGASQRRRDGDPGRVRTRTPRSSKDVDRLPLWGRVRRAHPGGRRTGAARRDARWARSEAETTSSSSAWTTDDRVWLMLHSGSRNIGKELAEFHISVAQCLPHNADLPDRDLAVFLTGTPEMQAYRHDLFWAQEYAAANRAAMLRVCTRTCCAGSSRAVDVRRPRCPATTTTWPRSTTTARGPRHAQGRDPRRGRRAWDHPRLDGDAVVHRPRVWATPSRSTRPRTGPGGR